jgi:hypothetical protein
LSTLVACGQQVLAPLSPLSTTDKAANAGKLAALVERQCFANIGEAGGFADRLKTIGWSGTRTQTAHAGKPLEIDVWVFPHLKVLRGEPANGISTCSLMVDASVAPSLDQTKASLSKVVGIGPGSHGEWWWNHGFARRLHMTVNHGTDGQVLFIDVENYRLPWWRMLESR